MMKLTPIALAAALIAGPAAGASDDMKAVLAEMKQIGRASCRERVCI